MDEVFVGGLDAWSQSYGRWAFQGLLHPLNGLPMALCILGFFIFRSGVSWP